MFSVPHRADGSNAGGARYVARDRAGYKVSAGRAGYVAAGRAGYVAAGRAGYVAAGRAGYVAAGRAGYNVAAIVRCSSAVTSGSTP